MRLFFSLLYRVLDVQRVLRISELGELGWEAGGFYWCVMVT